MKFRVRRLPSEAPVSIRIWPRRTPNRASPGVAKARDSRQFVGAQIREHRIHLQHDPKFGRFTHGNAFRSKFSKMEVRKIRLPRSVS
jgi:hypothetical protein